MNDASPLRLSVEERDSAAGRAEECKGKALDE